MQWDWLEPDNIGQLGALAHQKPDGSEDGNAQQGWNGSWSAWSTESYGER